MRRKDHFHSWLAIPDRSLAWDPADLLPGFESEEAAHKRDLLEAKYLEKHGRPDLADDLRRSIEREDTPPAWTHLAYRPLRRGWTNETTTLAHEAERATGHLGVVASIIPAGFTAPLGQLSAIRPRAIADAIWHGLNHLEFRGCEVVGGVDASFNEKAGSNQQPGHFQVHASLAFLGYPPSKTSRIGLAKALKAAFSFESTALIPIQVKPLRDPVRQLSYLLKRVFVRRVSIIDNRGRRNTLARPLKAAQSAEIAEWLSEFPQTDRIILKGLRRQGDRIVPTSLRKRKAGE